MMYGKMKPDMADKKKPVKKSVKKESKGKLVAGEKYFGQYEKMKAKKKK